MPVWFEFITLLTGCAETLKISELANAENGGVAMLLQPAVSIRWKTRSGTTAPSLRSFSTPVEKEQLMKRPSHKFNWFGVVRLLGMPALFLICAAPQSTAQQDNRQLKRDPVTQRNRVVERRVALVIGNGAYQNANRLANAANDAGDVAVALRVLGFELVGGRAHVDENADQMKRLIVDFGEMLSGGGVGLFYYAGHGVQSQGHNYLIPVEANLLKEKTLEFDAVDVNRVLAQMDAAGNGFNIVILDACRSNPFSRSWRDASQGLAQVNAPEGTLIAYATSPGRVASDGSGRNGTYTAGLLREMRVQGLTIEEMFKLVRAGVRSATKDQQTPWESSSLVGTFYFSPAKDNALTQGVSETKVDPSAFELSYWETIKSSNNPEDFKAYINEYPNGRFVALARNRVSSLENPAKPTESRSASDSGATELAFWNSIKNSNDPEDFKDYLSKYPGGQFSGVARRRIVALVPNPQLLFAGQEDYQSNGQNWTRYKLNVTNRAVYPDDLFAASPNLPPCGLNTKSARTWVDIYDGNGKRLYGFCALKTSEDLNGIWFALAQGQTAPSHIYIVLTDRLTNATHKSDQIVLPKLPSRIADSFPNPQLVFVGQEDYQSNGQNWTRYKLNVTNRAVYPDELFAASPKLPPCGKNTKSARTWVDIYDGAGKRLYGFCAFTTSEDLSKIWFALAQGETAPSQVYVVLADRLTNANHRSNPVTIP
jgi:uncharacterized caspase-like protein